MQHLWDVLVREIQLLDEQLTNVELQDAIDLNFERVLLDHRRIFAKKLWGGFKGKKGPT